MIIILSVRTHKDWIERYKMAHLKFLTYSTEIYSRYVHNKNFFKLIINEMIEDLKEQEEDYTADKEFLKLITKKGRGRDKGVRFVNKEDLATFRIGDFEEDDNIKELFYNVMFSLAKKENNKNKSQYSISYFMLDIVEYVEANLEKIYLKLKI